MYGCLAPLLKVPFPNRILQNHAKASMNLDNFVHRIDRTYFRQDAEGNVNHFKRLLILTFCFLLSNRFVLFTQNKSE